MMTDRKLDKSALTRNEDWYGNNAALCCPICNKTFIVSGFLNKGQRECPACGKSIARILDETVTISWSHEEAGPVVYSREELVASNRLDKYVTLVQSGGAVDEASIARGLPKLEKVAIIECGGKIVAGAAKKAAHAHYAEKVSLESCYQVGGETPELGYVVVAEQFRRQRFGRRVVERILLEFGSRPAFATTSNEAMKKLLSKYSFNWVGHEWRSERDGALLSLWIRDSVF